MQPCPVEAMKRKKKKKEVYMLKLLLVGVENE